jgi:protein TonB
MTSPHLEAVELPPGPDTDASVASPALAEQKAELRETELPKDVPTETDVPDRVVTPYDSKKPKEEDTRIAAVQTQASMESIAAEATATPSTEAIPEGPRSIEPAPSTGESARRMRATWRKELIAHLDKHKRYPAERVQKRVEILVGFALDGMGTAWATCSRPASSRDPATPRSTRWRAPWCGAPTRCRRPRRWSPTRD